MLDHERGNKKDQSGERALRKLQFEDRPVGKKDKVRACHGFVFLSLTLVFTTNVPAQNISGSQNQLRIDELSREAAKLKQQLQEKTQEIQRIVRENPNEQLVIPSESEVISSPVPPPKKEVFDKLGDVLKIRQSLKDPTMANLPAKLFYVHPAQGDDTIAVDAGLDLNILKVFNVSDEIRQRNEVDAFSEYHRNSGSTPPVDTFLAGIQGKHDLGRFNLGDGLGEWGNWLAGDASYKRDNIVSGQGFLGEIFYKPYSKNLGINSNQSFKSFPFVEYQFIPNIGLQFETGNGASSKFTSGDRVSFRAALGLTLDPFPISLDHRLEWSNTVNYWNQISTSGGYDQYDRNEYFFQSSLNLYLDEAKQVAIGVDYTYGDNLTTNQFDTNTWTFLFKANFGK